MQEAAAGSRDVARNIVGVSQAADEAGVAAREVLGAAEVLTVHSAQLSDAVRQFIQFAKAVGATVSVKTRPQVPGERRLRGTLLASDDEGFTLSVEGTDGEPVRLAYSDVDRVRTVFVWGGQDAPGRSSGGNGAARATGRKQTQKRKQVVTT